MINDSSREIKNSFFTQSFHARKHLIFASISWISGKESTSLRLVTGRFSIFHKESVIRHTRLVVKAALKEVSKEIQNKKQRSRNKKKQRWWLEISQKLHILAPS